MNHFTLPINKGVMSKVGIYYVYVNIHCCGRRSFLYENEYLYIVERWLPG